MSEREWLFGYNSEEVVRESSRGAKKWIGITLAVAFLVGVWFALNVNLLTGDDWVSATYDNDDWRANEGDMHTFGAWDFEAHVWKSMFVMENYPNIHWNPYWYLGMPLLKYYPLGFYPVHALMTALTGFSAARAALYLVMLGHLAAALLTFVLCYKVSRRALVGALCSVFVLASTFISLRSYGWEPITVVFLWLYPLGLLLYLRKPLEPFRLSVVLVVGLTYLMHPLIWFSLLMFIGIFLVSVLFRNHGRSSLVGTRPLVQYAGLACTSVLLGAVQFFPQLTYEQVTSGVHMGVKYLPFYQVPFNIVSVQDFLFDMANLKGPGPIILIALLFLIVFGIAGLVSRNSERVRMIFGNRLIAGLALVLGVMILFYYLELYDVFPMNVLRSIQYHRLIPEFTMTGAVLVAALYNVVRGSWQRSFYFATLITFVLASSLTVYGVSKTWETTPDIFDRPEFLTDEFEGRISFPYTDQSFSVRNSYTKTPQVYGYYEQGITNPYADEIFSVSSGFHSAEYTVLYLQAANVRRMYVNMEEGRRNEIVREILGPHLELHEQERGRYAYYEIPLKDASMAQAVSSRQVDQVNRLEPGCPRELFETQHCGSQHEEFVTKDPEEVRYLAAYVEMLELDHSASANFTMIDPDHYTINVKNASRDTAIVVKMTYDSDFSATVDGQEISIEDVGPYFMVVRPGLEGEYTVELNYSLNRPAKAGAAVSLTSLAAIALGFAVSGRRRSRQGFPRGDM